MRMGDVQNDICAIQARCRFRLGENYARDHAAMHWTRWRNDLCDAGMTRQAATDWIVANTEVEQAWVDDLEARYAAGRTRQVARMKRLAEQWAAEGAAQ